jgi:hypothetical protein
MVELTPVRLPRCTFVSLAERVSEPFDKVELGPINPVVPDVGLKAEGLPYRNADKVSRR